MGPIELVREFLNNDDDGPQMFLVHTLSQTDGGRIIYRSQNFDFSCVINGRLLQKLKYETII